jgi:hypothetical protein
MRIIRILFSTLLFILFLLFIGIFLGREILLTMAIKDLQRAAAFLEKTPHLHSCQDGFSISTEAWGQIRFENERDYYLESVCNSFASKPILLEERQLPMFVKKSAGTSGFVFDQQKNPSQITLTIFGKEIAVYSEDNQLFSGQAPQLSYATGPVSSCQAFNYRCCQEEVEKGVGEVQALASDCPKSCFKSCAPRPLIVSFNATSPNLADSSNIVINSGQAINFSFVVSDGRQELFSDQVLDNQEKTGLAALSNRLHNVVTIFDKLNNDKDQKLLQPITTTIFFGDGQNFSTQHLQGLVEHVYTCNNKVCVFEAWLEAKDARSTPSLLTELGRLTITVNN